MKRFWEHFWIIDPKEEAPSVSLTILVYCLCPTLGVCLLKLVFAGNHLFGITWGAFSGTEFAAVIGAVEGVLAGLYGWRKWQKDGTEDGPTATTTVTATNTVSNTVKSSGSGVLKKIEEEMGGGI